MRDALWRTRDGEAAGVNKRANGAIGGDKGKDLESIGRSDMFRRRKSPASPGWKGKRSDQKIRSDHTCTGLSVDPGAHGFPTGMLDRHDLLYLLLVLTIGIGIKGEKGKKKVSIFRG